MTLYSSTIYLQKLTLKTDLSSYNQYFKKTAEYDHLISDANIAVENTFLLIASGMMCLSPQRYVHITSLEIKNRYWKKRFCRCN